MKFLMILKQCKLPSDELFVWRYFKTNDEGNANLYSITSSKKTLTLTHWIQVNETIIKILQWTF